MTDIMLVDDEVLALEYLKNMVDWERNGYHVVGCATSGKKALELFDRTHPQIVISDIRMPGTDGLELTRQIKEKDKETVVDEEITALPMDEEGTLLMYEEEMTESEAAAV